MREGLFGMVAVLVATCASFGQVLVDDSNTVWDVQSGFLQVFLSLSAAGLDKDGEELPIAVGLGAAGDLLRQWQREGTAAGNHGDLYDNRDRDHSTMTVASFPQITSVEYAPALKQKGTDYGPQTRMLFLERMPALGKQDGQISQVITIGNSSTAWVGQPTWRSQYRGLLTRTGGGNLLALHYVANHLYVYPEHRDHDPGHNGKDGQGYGDVVPANTPYVILSQGSSGSDIPFMNAVAATLAAFRPEVKRDLAARGMLMPVVQMIFRMSNKQVGTPADYLTGKAHPTAFSAADLDMEKMVRLAHGMEASSLPPICILHVAEEDEPVVGRDYFDVAARERLLDTPAAIARIVKSSAYERRMVVSAERSRDPHDKPLTFHWAVLRGDEGRISITPMNAAGSVAEIKVAYHERRPVRPGSQLESNRVDIGVFAHNGTHVSAPAFVSLSYLDNEKREYDERHHIRVVDYTAADTRGNYVDPLLDLPKDWRDEYRYGDDGRLLGWTRIRGERREEFTAEGRVVTAMDGAGRPTATAAVRYVAGPGDGKIPVLQQVVEEGSGVSSSPSAQPPPAPAQPLRSPESGP